MTREDAPRVYGGLFGEELRTFADGHRPGPCTVRQMDEADAAHMQAVLDEQHRQKKTDGGRPAARICKEASP